MITFSFCTSSNCRFHDLTSSMKGKYCQGNGKTIPNVSLRQCRYIGLQSSSYLAINYKTAHGTCTLLTTTCPLLMPDPDFEFSIFIPQVEADQCYEWRPVESNKWSRGVAISGGRYAMRILKSGISYVGRWGGAEGTCRSNDGTVAMSSRSDGLTCHILWIKDGCTAYLHPYTIGNALPSRSVVGGVMPDGKTTYIAYYTKWGVMFPGYYIEGAAYVQGEQNKHSITDFPILVLI